MIKRSRHSFIVATIPLVIATATNAQDAAPEPGAAQLDEIIVTGSRLATTGRDTSAPVTVLDRSEIDATGASSVGELLRELPVATASASDSAGRGNGGSATVALRGLSAVNTLVLINGRRVLSNNEGGTVDLNSIPFEAVERVEVLQDGASAVYGSDAIAGVVNIIMRRDFEGLMLKGGYGVASRGDLPNREASATFGHAADQGSFVFNASWRKADGNFIADRPVSRDPDWRAQGGRNFRDPLPVVAVVQGLPGFGNAERVLRDGVAQATTVNDFRQFVFPDTGDPLASGNDGINYWLYETSASDISQNNVSFTGDYKFSESLTGFVEASFNRRKSAGFLAPDYFGAVYGDPIILSANNDFNPFGVDLSVARTIGEQPFRGRRQSSVTADVSRLVAGVEGEIGAWKWDISYNHQDLDQLTFDGEGVLRDRLQQAAGDSDDCRAAGNGCVPINLLGGPGTITPEMLDFISADSSTTAKSTLQSAVVNFSGDLFAMPAGDVRMAIGAEFRREDFSLDNDRNAELNAFIARGPSPDAFPPEREIKEVYAELAVPLLKEVAFAKSLDLELAGRFSDYNAFGNTTNPKAGLKWRPFESLLVRGSWGTGFRAPTFAEAYGGQTRGFAPIVDPCAGPNFATLPGCGGRQAPANTTGTFIVTGGNPGLEPEDADNLTFGLVYTPTFAPRLALTLDYYRITKEGIIGSIDRNYILAQNAANGSYADRITRDPTTNSVQQIIATRANLLDQSIRGIDFGVQYQTEATSIGTIGFRTDLTYLDTFEQSPAPGAPPVRRVGTYTDATGTLARLRGTGRVSWMRGGFTLSTAARYVGGVRNDGSLLVDGKHLQADSYVQNDWLASYEFEPAKLTVTVSVENIFDEMPPFLEGNYANGFDQGSFNSRGRFFMSRIVKSF
jgi:outer membrane receptor protein involved in Fe transport